MQKLVDETRTGHKHPSHVKRAFLLALTFVVLPLFLSGCLEGTEEITTESLDEANVSGAGPANVKASFEKTGINPPDMWLIDVSWDGPEDAMYQVEVKRNQTGKKKGEWYQLRQKSPTEDESPVVESKEVDDHFMGFDARLYYRVRTVYSADEVSEWSESEALTIPRGNVLYEVEGTAKRAYVTMRTGTGQQQAEVILPLMKNGKPGLMIQASKMTPYISARASTAGTVTCRITVKGIVVSENTGSSVTCTM